METLASGSSSMPVELSPGKARNLVSQNVRISSIGPGQTRPCVIRNKAADQDPVVKQAIRYSFAQKVQVITLRTHKYNPQYVEFCTGIAPRAQSRIMETARKRGYDFLKDPRILDAHIVEGRTTGRPKGSKDSQPRKSGPRKKRKNADEHSSEAINNNSEVEDNPVAEHNNDSKRYAYGHAQMRGADGIQRARSQTNEFQSIALQLAGIQEYLPLP